MDWGIRFGVVYTWIVILCLKYVVSVDIHVDVRTIENAAESVIFNNTLGEGWSYSLTRDSRSHHVNQVISLDSTSGVVYIKNIDNVCNTVVKNPLDLQIISKSHFIDGVTNYTLTRLTIYFHNTPCSVPFHRKSSLTSLLYTKYSTQSVIFSDKFYQWNSLTCLDSNQTLLHLQHFIPISIFEKICEFKIKNPNYALSQDFSIVSTRIQCLSEAEISIPVELLPCGKTDYSSLSALLTIHPTDSISPRVENSIQHKEQVRLKRQTATNTKPEFEQSVYRVTVSENQTPGLVIILSATDPDEGESGKLTYSMVAMENTLSNDMFTIDPVSGKVSTTVELDREEIPSHRFYVTATDNSVYKKSGVATLIITVKDENDHSPTFDQDVFKIEKPENLPVSTTITTMRAIDKDEGTNKEVRYSIIDPANPTTFKIDPILGTISTLKVLNRETQASYQLIIQAKDQAQVLEQRRSSTTTVDITVIDENDNYPQFDQSSYSLNVSENLDVSSRPVIIQVSASDADEGRNKEITYSITSGNIDNTFYIDPTTGEVSVQKPLDYETNKEFNLKIKASDNGVIQMTNSTTMWIRIDDLNDNPPYFLSDNYQGSVQEGASIGTSVSVNVRALDKDDGINSELEYTLKDVPPGFPFAIDPDSGQISVRSTLDREIQSSYMFVVQVNDKGQPSLSATVSVEISIIDINDNNPIFSPKTYNVSISEKTDVYEQVVQVTANDADAGSNAKLVYQIVSGNNDQVFSIESNTGIITLAKPLDYKVQKKYILTVRASDSGPGNKFDTAEVHISVTDTNKFRPVFTNTPYQLNVDENAEIGTSVGKVFALDDDIGENGRITYELYTQGILEFKIDANTGEITTHEVLDREHLAAYSFDVRASDHGDPIFTDTAGVIVHINDKNDNAPKFEEPVYKASVSETAYDGEIVTTVHAVDYDAGKNQQVKYSFSELSSTNGDFEIDEANGNIYVATGSRLDREKRNNYTLTVLAIDSGFLQLTGSATLIIKLEDVNDNAPQFNSDEIEVYVNENQPIGSTVAVIQADDPDEGVNAVVEYAFDGGLDADKFLLSSQPGEPAIIVNYVDLDYESDKKVYYIRLKASSGPLISSALIIIKVQDINDNKPVLEDFTIIFNNYIDHFPSEPIGRIPAFDPDVSDQAKLKYTFLLGNEAGFLNLSESTGEIRLDSRLNSDVPRNGTIQVKVSDGSNDVIATCRLHVRLVTMEMLYNSVTIRINNMTSADFLSPLFTFFVDALATIINVQKANIFVINVRNDTDVRGQVLNVTVSVREKSVRVDRQLIDVFYSAEFLKEQIYLQRMLLANLSTLQILPFDDNLCLHQICAGFERCLSKLKFGEAAPFISSRTMMFRSIHPDNGYKCECPTGFVDSDNFNFCDVEVNLCYSNPCNGTGECVSTEGGYTCKCKDGYTGDSCEIDLNGKYEASSCPANACQPPSKCVPLIEGGFRCDHCPNNIDYDHLCRLTARSFPKGSFLMYPTLKKRYRFKIQFQFATQERNGLLFYNGRFNELHDFIALEIVDSQVQFSFSTGADIVKVSAYVKGGVNDGHWRQITVDYLDMTATVTVGEDCDTEIAVKYGKPINYTCAARGSFTSPSCAKEGNVDNCPKLLDLTGPLQIGGLPTLPSNFQVKNKDFVGCMKDFYIDENLLDFNDFVANNGTQPGCAARHKHCSSAPCQHGGTCTEGWGTYLCSCPDRWDGKDCGQSTDPPRKLSGDGYLHYSNNNGIISPVNFPWFNGISIRTRQANGTIMFIYTKSVELIHIELVNGFISYSYTNNVGTQSFMFDSVTVDDGQWHYFETRWLSNGDLQMILDYGERQVVHKIQSTLERMEILGVYVGALKIGQANAQSHFRGCVKHIKVGNTQTALLSQPQVLNAQSGCGTINACDSNPCTARAQCIDEWESYSCKCPPGTLGPNCDSICTTYNPCENMAYCRHPLGGTYECECGQKQSGQYCEVTQQPCLKDWWGFPVCGPCPDHCTWENGFDPNCNNKTGECTCRDHYYRPPGSATCLPCNCYMHGSHSAQCDRLTGLCPCIDGVIGRRCDQCPSRYAEIRLDEETNQYGCKVDYEACPRIYSHGMWWDAKMLNSLVKQHCPDNAIGVAKRNCSGNGLWHEPDFFNCTNLVFRDHATQIEKMENGTLKINVFVAKTIMASLADSTSRTVTMFGNDLNITARIMDRILNYETEQDGLNLTSEQDSRYLYNLISVLSDILQAKYSKEWIRINQRGPGAMEILSKLETYLSKLLSALEITTTESSRPYNVITDNIVLSVDFINKSNFTGRSIPKFDNIVKTTMFDEDTSIKIPASMLETSGLQDFLKPDRLSSPKGYVGYILYRNIGDLLPKSYAENVRVVEGRPMSVNSPVFMVKVKDDGHVVPGPLSDPVVITFKQLTTHNRTSPQCVSWQYNNTGHGKWSTAGCSLIDRYTIENKMYIKCTCEWGNMTNYAVLMDISNVEYDPTAPVVLQALTYVCLIVGMSCLTLCFIISFFLKRIQCNANSIHINLIFVIFISLLAFLIGIDKTQPEHELYCRLVAIALHYFFMAGFSWLFVDVLHAYRMMTEIRNIDQGSMKFYYLIAYVVPGIIVSLAVGLNTEGYGNPNFCWLLMADKFIWSFAGPIAVSVIINIFVFVLAMKASCQEKTGVSDIAPIRICLFANIIILMLWGIIWVTGLLAVNYNYDVLHIIFAFLCLGLGVFVCIMYIILNSKVRYELKKLWYRVRGHKLDLDENIGGTRSSVYSRSALAYRNDQMDSGMARINVGISTTSTTSRSTSKSSGGLYKGEEYLRSTSTSSGNTMPVKYANQQGPYGYDPDKPDGLDPDSMQIHAKRDGNDSDSDSEMSERVSLDLASSHSSDDDDDLDVQLDWESQLPKNKKIEEAKEQMRKKKEEFLAQQQQQQPLPPEPSPMVPSAQHQYHNPFEHHIYSGTPSPKFSPKMVHAPGHWPGDPQLSGYTGSDSEYRSSDQPTLSSTQPDVTLQTPEYKGREQYNVTTPRRSDNHLNDSLSSNGPMHSPMGSPHVMRSPRETPRSPVREIPRSPVHKLQSPVRSPVGSPRSLLGSPRDHSTVKVLTHRGSVSSDSECSHETCV